MPKKWNYLFQSIPMPPNFKYVFLSFVVSPSLTLFKPGSSHTLLHKPVVPTTTSIAPARSVAVAGSFTSKQLSVLAITGFETFVIAGISTEEVDVPVDVLEVFVANLPCEV